MHYIQLKNFQTEFENEEAAPLPEGRKQSGSRTSSPDSAMS